MRVVFLDFDRRQRRRERLPQFMGEGREKIVDGPRHRLRALAFFLLMLELLLRFGKRPTQVDAIAGREPAEHRSCSFARLF